MFYISIVTTVDCQFCEDNISYKDVGEREKFNEFNFDKFELETSSFLATRGWKKHQSGNYWACRLHAKELLQFNERGQRIVHEGVFA